MIYMLKNFMELNKKAAGRGGTIKMSRDRARSRQRPESAPIKHSRHASSKDDKRPNISKLDFHKKSPKKYEHKHKPSKVDDPDRAPTHRKLYLFYLDYLDTHLFVIYFL